MVTWPQAAVAEPSADFTVTPAPPIAGDPATYKAVLSEYRGNVQWNFNADPDFEKKGAEVQHRYLLPGEKQVTMRVVRGGEVQVTVTKAIVVAPRPPGEPPPLPDPEPEPEPGPVVPSPPAPPTQTPAPPTAPGDPPPSGEVDGSSLSLMTPFPVVRVAGVLMPWGAKVRLLSVRSPRGAMVTVRCKGKGCPLQPFRRRVRDGLLRIRSLERRLRAGIRLEIFVRQGELIGKYTRFRIRSGARPLLRVDRCLEPGYRKPVRCPAA